MREFLFRGKRKDNGEWIIRDNIAKCAYEVDDETKELIEVYSYYLNGVVVDAKTVGQYTGLTDKNGKKIFEGDIVKHYCSSEDKTIFDIGQLYWCENICQFMRTSRTEGQFYNVNSSCEYEVIGNIHDNPELLKGGEG